MEEKVLKWQEKWAQDQAACSKEILIENTKVYGAINKQYFLNLILHGESNNAIKTLCKEVKAVRRQIEEKTFFLNKTPGMLCKLFGYK